MRRSAIITIEVFSACVVVLGLLLVHFRPAGIVFFKIDAPLSKAWAIAVAGFALFSLYWEAKAKQAAAAKSSESALSRGFHVTLTNLALMLEAAPIHGMGRFLPANREADFAWMSPATSRMTTGIVLGGLAIEAAGLWLAVWARRHLGRNWSGEISIKVEHQLIRSGPYRLLRHPIYTGILAMYLGMGLVMCKWLAAIGFAIVAVAYWRKIRLEEANLTQAFGADFDAYRKETWALLPGVF